MTRVLRWCAPVLLASVLATGCQRLPSEGTFGSPGAPMTAGALPPYPTLTPNQKPELIRIDQLGPEELHQQLQNKDFLLVNTHVPYEGEIAQTDAFIPYDQIEQNLPSLPADKSAKIVVYCRSGRMSRIATDTLTRLGYSNVWDLDGGMIAWEKAGFAIEGK